MQTKVFLPENNNPVHTNRVRATCCSDDEKLSVVTFEREVLTKYTNNPDYTIETPENVGILKSNKQGWQLQIDVQENFINTYLYKLSPVPEDEQAHFAKYNIWPRELSETAKRRWVQGKP